MSFGHNQPMGGGFSLCRHLSSGHELFIKNDSSFEGKDGFRNIDPNTLCFCLTASKKCIHGRLKERGDELGSWAYSQTEDCIRAYSSGSFGEYIDTDNKSIKDIIDYIISELEEH